MKRMTLATLALLATTPIASAQEHSAEAVAAAILTGFTQTDITMFLPHLNAYNAANLNAEVAVTLSFDEIFNDERAAAAIAWDGMILPAHYDNSGVYFGSENPVALVPFAIETDTGGAPLGSGAQGRLIVVTLTLDSPEDTTWGWKDFIYMDLDQYMAFLEERL